MVNPAALTLQNSCGVLSNAQSATSRAHQDDQLSADSGLDVTVAIPTYNGAKRLPAVLDRLRGQVGTGALKWEVIVADNNSVDETAAVVRTFQQQWSDDVSLRYSFVADQGAAFARQRAVEIARGEIIAFLDDDNLPEKDWVMSVHRFSCEHTEAGAFGSQIHGEFETPLPDEIRSIACFLAIVERGEKPHLYEPAKKMLPPGAGLAVRREAWLENVPKRLFLNHKGKKAGLASEDLEAILHIQKAGWQVWYNPEMVVYHRIPAARLQADYMRSLLRCIGLSRFYIRMLGLRDWQRPLMVPAYIANDIRKLVLHTLKFRHTPLALSDACEREHLISTLQSPVFIARKALHDVTQDVTHRTTDEHSFIVRQLEEGFEKEQFRLFQQPVFEYGMSGGELLHTEVLLRLSSPLNAESLLLPKRFLPVAEANGLSRTIDHWVLRKLMAIVQTVSQTELESGMISPLGYSINLSEATVRDVHFVDFLADLLSAHDFPPDLLSFEVSEKVIANNLQPALNLSHRIKSLGCQFIVDDFRKGNVLLNFPADLLDCIKVNFSANITDRRLKRLRFVHSQLGRAAQQTPVNLVAKGIENSKMRSLAATSGIFSMQGYELGKPEPLEDSLN